MMALSSPLVTAEQLATVELFSGLEPEALTEVARSGRVTTPAAGTVLFAQGAHAERCYALIAGRVRIAQSDVEGGQTIVRFIAPGSTFGTLALFTDHRYPAEASAVVASLEISWAEPALLALMDKYPQIARNLIKIAGARLREMQDRMREIATQRVEQRIAHTLLRVADPAGSSAKNGAVISFPLSRQDIASMCGATLYTVSRVLKSWQKAGYIETGRKRVDIRQLAQIRRLAGDSGCQPPPHRLAP